MNIKLLPIRDCRQPSSSIALVAEVPCQQQLHAEAGGMAVEMPCCCPQERLPVGQKLRCVEAASVVLQAEHRYTAKLTLAEAPEGEQASAAQQQPQQQQPGDAKQKALGAGPAGQEGGAAGAAGQSQHQEADQSHPRPNRRPRARHRDPGHWRWRLISFELLPGAVTGCSSCIARGLVLAGNGFNWPRHGCAWKFNMGRQPESHRRQRQICEVARGLNMRQLQCPEFAFKGC